jgi:hypothetical protein
MQARAARALRVIHAPGDPEKGRQTAPSPARRLSKQPENGMFYRRRQAWKQRKRRGRRLCVSGEPSPMRWGPQSGKTPRGVKGLRESQRETDKQIEETLKRMVGTDKRLGALFNRFGEMVEYMILPNLMEKFEELGFAFTKASRPVIKGKEHGIFTDIDALLENGGTVMAVEIKSKPDINDINCHIERMEELRRCADARGDRRVYLGAVAGAVFNDSEKAYVLKRGFYVVEPSGESFKITAPKDPRGPREWLPARALSGADGS